MYECMCHLNGYAGKYITAEWSFSTEIPYTSKRTGQSVNLVGFPVKVYVSGTAHLLTKFIAADEISAYRYCQIADKIASKLVEFLNEGSF